MAPSPGTHAAKLAARRRKRKTNRKPRKECAICAERVFLNQFPKDPHAFSSQGDGQQHGSDVCFKCYSQHVEAEITNKGSDLVCCPQCPQILAEPEVRKLAQRCGTYQKYT